MASRTPEPPQRRLSFDLRSTWRAAWILVGVGLLVWLGVFFVTRAASTIVVLVLAFFIALAMEPIVGRLAKRLPRPASVAVVMIVGAAFIVGFFWIFGSMLADQLARLITALPGAADGVLGWVNDRFGTSYEIGTILGDFGIDTGTITSFATSVAGSLLTILGDTAFIAFQTFAFAFFLFNFSAALPRLRTWLAELLPKGQVVFLTVWQTMLIKVGGYVGARLVLAAINATAMGIFMVIIDMPYWLPLAIWTGLVAQFVPNVGTYISIALPIIVGLASDQPLDGVWILAFAIAYQQIENIFIEPRIASRAVDVHPAVAFASALIGAQLFGLIGALLGVPLAATIMAVFDLYKRRWTVSADTEQEVAALVDEVQDDPEEEESSNSAGSTDSRPG